MAATAQAFSSIQLMEAKVFPLAWWSMLMRRRPSKPLEAGAFDAVAFEQDGGGMGFCDCAGDVDALDAGKIEVVVGDGVGEDDLGLAAHLAQDVGEREDGPDRVAVGAGVGGDDKAWGGAKGLQRASRSQLL